jgi:hypothetical protein
MSRPELWASRILLAGGLVGVAVMLIGVVETVLHHSGIGSRLTTLGIVTLCAAPFTAVVSAGVAFALDGDRRFTMIAAIVTALLLLSFWIGAHA